MLLLNFFSTKIFLNRFSRFVATVTAEKIHYNTQEVFSKNLLRIYSALIMAFNSSEFIRYQKAEGSGSIFDVEKIIENIQATTANNPLIENICFYFVKKDTVIDGASKYDFETYFNSKMAIGSMTADNWTDFFKTNKSRYLLIGEPDSPDSRIIFTVGLPSPDVYMIATFDQREFKNYLFGGSSQNGKKYFIFDQSGSLVFSSDPAFHVTDLESRDLFWDLAPDSKGNLIEKIHGRDNLITYCNISTLGWTIININDLSDFHTMSDTIKLFIFILSMIMILICFYASGLLSFSSYKPVINVIEFIHKNSGAPDKSADKPAGEFNVIQESLAAYAMQNQQFQDFHNNSIDYLLERFYYWVAKGIIVDEIALAQYLRELKINFDHRYYSVLAIKINETPGYRYLKQSKGATSVHIQMYMRSVLMDIAKDKIAICPFFDDKILGVIIGFSTVFSHTDLMRAFQNRIEKELEIKFSVGISGVKNTWSEISAAYDEAYAVLEMFAFNAVGQVASYDTSKLENDISVYFPHEEEQSVINLIVAGNLEKLSLFIEKVFDTNLKRGATRYTDIMFISYQFINIALRAIFGQKSNLSEIYGRHVNLYSEITKINTFAEMQNYIKRQYETISTKLSEITNSNNAIKQEITRYIENNYTEDISLETMAEAFNFSPLYFRKYFKSMMGLGFADAVNACRIKKALQLKAADGNLTFVQIADMVGFNNYKSFARNFKKYTGYAPSDFKGKPHQG